MPRFIYETKCSVGEQVKLSKEDSHHAKSVLRIAEGEAIELIDGKGNISNAIISYSGKDCIAQIQSCRLDPRRSKVCLVFAIPKGPALEFILHRCTEVGVATFQPIVSQHSLKADGWNSERWNRVIRETCKQCEENFFPEIQSPIRLEEWLEKREKRSLYFCDETDRASATLQTPSLPGDVVVGAEGGWSATEIESFTQAGCIRLGLGKNRLRAETAGLAAVVLVKRLIGEI